MLPIVKLHRVNVAQANAALSSVTDGEIIDVTDDDVTSATTSRSKAVRRRATIPVTETTQQAQQRGGTSAPKRGRGRPKKVDKDPKKNHWQKRK